MLLTSAAAPSPAQSPGISLTCLTAFSARLTSILAPPSPSDRTWSLRATPANKLVISGGLMVNGFPDHLVYFTSYRDDTIRGDTDGGGSSSGSPADWGWIEFTPSSDDASTISFAVIRYRRVSNPAPLPTLEISTSKTLHQPSRTAPSGTAPRAVSTSYPPAWKLHTPPFTNNSFTTNDTAAISINPASLLTLSGNSATGNHPNAVDIRSGSITSSVTWDQSDLPYRLVGTVNVNLGATLTIGPDMVFKGTPANKVW